MVSQRVWQAARGAAIVASFTFIFAVLALAQEGGQNAPGRFDFYVLSLSWSPSYCEAVRQRAPDRPPGPQCEGRPFAFVVHGLWPQFEQGFPSYCQVPAPRLPRTIVNDMLDLMPSPQLVFHEWDRHGTCSGLAPRAYFDTIRKAYAAVKIPDDYRALDRPAMVTPEDVVAAFLKANPDLRRTAIAVGCSGNRLSEVRVCLNKDFSFHDCAQVVRRSCRRDKIAMPAVRAATN